VSNAMALFLFLFVLGGAVGLRFRFPILIAAVLAFVVGDVVLAISGTGSVDLLDLALGVVALQLGYLTGLLGITLLRERRSKGG